ncbi:MAG: tetratricopeptide repeat protein [Bacteroidales bacterium]|nr:tetratricopeptide repeat protein [Bacteroidales bacterium]
MGKTALPAIILALSMFCGATGMPDVRDEAVPAAGQADTLTAKRLEAESAVLDAVALLESARVAESAALLDSLLQAAPSDDAAHYYRGLCHYAQQDAAGAIRELERAAALDTANLWYRETLANLYLAVGDAEKAGDVYTYLSGRNPLKYRNTYTLPLMAEAYQAHRDYDRYFATLQQLVQDGRLAPAEKSKYLSGSISLFRGELFRQLMPRMDTLFHVFAEAEPLAMEPHELLAELAYLRRDFETVIRESREIIRLSDGNRETALSRLSLIGDCYHEMGNRRKSYAAYKQALKIDARYSPVLNNYAYFLCLEKRSLKKAEAMSRLTIEDHPDNATYLDTYGWILFRQGRAKEAKPYFKHAMVYGGKENAVVLSHYAAVLEALGEQDLAAYYRNLAEEKE